MANNLCKKLYLVFILLSIFFVSFIHGLPSLDRNASERNTGMKLSGGAGGGARGAGGGASGSGGGGARGSGGGGRAGKLPYGTVIPLYGGNGGHKSHRSSAASQGSYCSLALVLVAAAVGAAIL